MDKNHYQQYGNQPPTGYYYPQYGNYNPYNHIDIGKNNFEKKTLRTISIIVGSAVIGFTLLSILLSFILNQIPNFSVNYKFNDIFSISVDCIYAITTIGIPFLLGYLLLKKKKMIKALPLGTPYNYSAFTLLIFAALMACLLGSYATGIFSGMVENLFGIKFFMPEDGAQLTTVPIILLYIVKTAVIPAFIEEFAIRGVVMQPLRKYGDMFAIVMSSLVFALMHGNMVQIPFAFIAGIAIGYSVIITGSIWTGVIIHFLNNFISVTMQVIFDNFNENQAAITTSLIVLTVITGGVICAIVYYRKFSKVPLSKGTSTLPKNEKIQSFVITAPMIIAFIFLLFQTAQYVNFNG